MPEKAYVIRNNGYLYWLGGFYGKDNFGYLTRAKIYQTEKEAMRIKNKIEGLYNIYVTVVKINMIDTDLWEGTGTCYII